MPEQHDPFDLTLRDRIGAAESRVRVSSDPPGGLPAGTGPTRWLRPAMVLATVAAAVVLAVFVIGQLPDRSTGDASPSPSAPEGVSTSARNGDFVLTLSSPRSMWTTEDAIQVTATLSYDGDAPSVEIGGAGGPVVFSLRQLEGGDAVLQGGQEMPCLRYSLGPDAPLVWPFEKAGGIADEPPFDRAFFEDPELRLPPGRWEVRAVLEYGDPDCGNWQELAVSIQVVVDEWNPSRPSPAVPSPSDSPRPPPPTPVDDDPAEITGVLRGDRTQGIDCIWLTDAQGDRWEVFWPVMYRQEIVDGVATLSREGQVVAVAGDTITVRGARSLEFGSVCMIGIVYAATEVIVE